MPIKLITLILFALLSMPASSQQQSPTGQATDAVGGQEADAAAEDEAGPDTGEEEPDDSDLDEQTYEEDDDDFVPTEEIPADEPIPFPSNI